MTSNESTLRELYAFLDEIEREYDFEPSPSPDPLARLRYILEQFAGDEASAERKLKDCRSDLAKTREERDKLLITVRTIGKSVGMNSYELERVLGVKRKPRKVKRKQ